MLIEPDDEIWGLVREVVSGLGCEVLDIEMAGTRDRQVIRVYVEKLGGIFISDCVAASRELGKRFEEEDVIRSSYRLEVSSPGIERPLRKIRDFKRYVGHQVRVRLKGKQKVNRRIAGKIVEVGDNTVHLLARNGENLSFSIQDIAKANLDVDWEAEFEGQRDTE